jgi:hypothetical protein
MIGWGPKQNAGTEVAQMMVTFAGFARHRDCVLFHIQMAEYTQKPKKNQEE